MSNHIFNFIFETSQYPLLHLFVDMSILKSSFQKKKNYFARLIFPLNKFQEMGTKSLSFQNSFSASYFPISQEPLDQNS